MLRDTACRPSPLDGAARCTVAVRATGAVLPGGQLCCARPTTPVYEVSGLGCKATRFVHPYVVEHTPPRQPRKGIKGAPAGSRAALFAGVQPAAGSGAAPLFMPTPALTTEE